MEDESLDVNNATLFNEFFNAVERAKEHARNGKLNLAKTQYLVMLELYDRLRNNNMEHHLHELAYEHISTVFQTLNNVGKDE